MALERIRNCSSVPHSLTHCTRGGRIHRSHRVVGEAVVTRCSIRQEWQFLREYGTKLVLSSL